MVVDSSDSISASRAATDKKPSSIERIQRLERMEQERLEEKQRKEERRRQVVAGAKPSGGRHDLVDRIEQVTKFPMTVLGVVWLVLAIVVLTTDVDSSASTAAVAVLFALWVIVLVEYLVRLVVTPDTRGYVKRRWVEPATVVVPVFQGWHIVGIERMSLLVREGQLRAQYILRHHSLFRVLIAVVATIFLGSWLVLLFEEHAKGSNIHDYPDALWWAIVTVTTVGYGDRFPTTEGGRIVAVVLMLVGIGLIGTLTATVAVRVHQGAHRRRQGGVQEGPRRSGPAALGDLGSDHGHRTAVGSHARRGREHRSAGRRRGRSRRRRRSECLDVVTGCSEVSWSSAPGERSGVKV